MSIVIKNIGVIFLSLLLHLYFYQSDHIKKFDCAFYDFITELIIESKEKSDSFYTVVVDVDEKSLHELGQWPWSRVIDAKLITSISSMNPSALGVNILFPEEDRASPIHIQEFYNKFFNLKVDISAFPTSLLNNDTLLSQSIDGANATLAIYLKNSTYMDDYCKKISYKNNLFSKITTKFNATALDCNHQSIQEGVENFGFINASVDGDGTFRRMPLFMNYNQQVFPSFALATLLSFDNSFSTGNQEDTILIHFSQSKPKVFSAVDVLYGRVPKREIQGKVVILGSSIVGLSPKYTIASGQKISNSMIHAFTIDNLLSNTFLTQPQKYKQINLLFSFILSLIVILLLFSKRYAYIVVVFFATVFLSSLWLLYSYVNGVYVSIGYLWTPLFYFFVVVLLYHIKVLNGERNQQEKFLIKQSKFASMGEMISLIAHQWRQPLSTINGIVLNIDVDQRKKILEGERLDNHLNQIEETTAYLSKTINDFTDFFSQNKSRDIFYMEEVIAQAKKLTVLSKEQNIQIIYKNRKSIEFRGYKSELIQSLLILFNNSIYACQRNMEEITFGKIYVESVFAQDKLVISIEDNGGGIKVKELKKIFNPYFTTKGEQHGTGLGLYILKLIVEDSMNGKVSVRNGEFGAIFTLELPCNL